MTLKLRLIFPFSLEFAASRSGAKTKWNDQNFASRRKWFDCWFWVQRNSYDASQCQQLLRFVKPCRWYNWPICYLILKVNFDLNTKQFCRQKYYKNLKLICQNTWSFARFFSRYLFTILCHFLQFLHDFFKTIFLQFFRDFFEQFLTRFFTIFMRFFEQFFHVFLQFFHDFFQQFFFHDIYLDNFYHVFYNFFTIFLNNFFKTFKSNLNCLKKHEVNKNWPFYIT